MITTMMRRLHGEEDGYSLVISMLLIAIMMMLLAVALTAGNAALTQSNKGLQWSKTLVVAEAGLNDSVARLAQSKSAANPCAISTATVCTSSDGEYQVSWSVNSDGGYTITSIGYYPTKTAQTFAREVQVTFEPVPSFRYAIFSQSDLEIKNNIVVVGDVYSQGSVTVGTSATVCGSVTSSGGGISLSNGAQIVKSYSNVFTGVSCSGKTGNVWSGGSSGIVGAATVQIAGDAKASAPASATCDGASSDYAITSPGGNTTVSGAVTACGKATGVVGFTSRTQGTLTTQPSTAELPSFTFDPNNYSILTCYPSGGTCGANDSTTAIADFNAYVATHKTSLTGTFAVWQRAPTAMSSPGNCTTASTTQICLDGIGLSGDFTLITNAPVDFGNTSTVSTSNSPSEMVVVSTYVPPASTSCDANGGDCSIYGQNAVKFDAGVQSDPDDGVVGLLYTTGKMAFKNQGSPGEGALYAAAMDLKNGFDIVYNSRIESILGFGEQLEQTLWQELNV